MVTSKWRLHAVSVNHEVPTLPLLELLAKLQRRPIAQGLLDWLGGRAPLRRLAIAEHRPGMLRLIDRFPVAAGSSGRGWPAGSESPPWPPVDRQLIRWLHGSEPQSLRVAIAHTDDEACVLFACEADSAYAIHASHDPGLGGFTEDELERWATAALLLQQMMRHPLSAAHLQVDAAESLFALRAPQLSGRERQVVARIACGLTNDGIAVDLALSPLTILTLRRRAYRKLGISSRVELHWLLS